MPASLQGVSRPAFYRVKLGGFEVATVLDAKAIRDGLHPHYGANASVDDVHALARANNIDTQRFEHPNIPTIVNTGKQLVLFDTGNGALPRFVLGRIDDIDAAGDHSVGGGIHYGL